VFVLDARDMPVQSMRDGVLVGGSAFQRDSPVIKPLIAQLRAAMKARSETLQNLQDSTPAIAYLTAEDIALLDGHPAIISVRPIIPSTPALAQTPGTESLHVAVQFIDQTLVDKIAKEFALVDARLVLKPEESFWRASIPVTNTAGEVLGYLQWTRDRPGTKLMGEAAPALAGCVLAGFTLLAFLLRRLRRSSIELQASEAQAQYLAFHDTLTGLPNRALFEDRLDHALAGVRRGESKLALLCIDIDRFKNINDTLGHPAGDELVRQVGKRLIGAIRDTDTVARLGGDEFAIIQVDIRDERDAERLARGIAAAMEKPFDLMGMPAHATATIGIALSQGEATQRDDMLRKADIALYEAKDQGRARHQVFAGDMDDVVRRRRLIESDLRAALAAGTQIGVVYQPVYAANSLKIVGAEALVRWDHPVHGPLSPELFIGIAEERGLIEQLGEKVLRQACAFASTSEVPWVAVNVSPLQFRNERFIDRVVAALSDSGLAPERLQLEITEGVLLENPGMTNSILAGLREKGIRIALDDFGTGYSSMNYLRRYSVDKLKIDRSFIQELGTSDDCDAIVRAMVALGRALHMQVTAEGVETIGQRDQLALIGCHELQGYLLSRPISADQLRALLARNGDVHQLPAVRSH
jgi:diguanylate cyclase (GGDEF)-like protein